MSREPRTWGEVLWTQADARAGEPAFSFLTDGERETAGLTWDGLLGRASAIAAVLLDRGAAGQPVLLLYPPGLDYVAGFLGCLYAGAIAVPLYPPDPARLSRTLPRLGAVAADARAALALTTTGFAALLESSTAEVPALRALSFLATDAVPDGSPRPPARPPDGIAYLQYTSGSTGSPKGVVVSHRNLLDHCADLARVWRLAPGARMVSWLPLFHDMGLIAAVFATLHAGVPTQLMSPVAFVQRPERWLRAIDAFGATVSGAPNFAYDLCVDKVAEAEREALDLSRWEVAFNAAEPVRAATLRRFTAAFAWSGFRAEAFVPSYGLAEATLLISGTKGDGPPSVLRVDADRLAAGELVTPPGPGAASRQLVSCGSAVPSYDLRIVDPDTGVECPDGVLGEVWASGPCVAGGYRGHPEATTEVFAARTADGAGPFLRTGDLGFRYRGELYPAARRKDLIIVRGRNHYPSDVEHAAERSDPLLRRGCSAAVADADERVILLQEVREPADERRRAAAIDAIRAAVVDQCDIAPDEVVLVERGELAKTSSGKIQRRLCRDRYLAGELRVLAVDRTGAAATAPPQPADPRADARAWLREWLPGAVDRPDVPLVSVGLDSLRATELGHRLQRRFGVRTDQAALLGGLTGADLLALVTGPAAAEAEPEPVTPPGEYPLSPGQRALWFLHRLAPESPAYNQVFAADLHSPLDTAVLRHALHALVERHPALRTVYGERDGQPHQEVLAATAVDLIEVDAGDWSGDRVDGAVAEFVHRPFALTTAPPLRVLVLRRGPAATRLLLCAHHLAVDFWALDVLVAELGAAYRAAATGTDPAAALGPPPADHLGYARDRRADSGSAEYWARQLAGVPSALDLPVARRRPAERSGRGDLVTLPLDAELTARTHEFARAAGATPYTVLLTAFQTLLHRYTGQDDVVVGSPTAGRADARFAGTVGYLVNMVGMRARFPAGATFRSLVAAGVSTVTGALAHQEHPLSEVVDRLGLHRDPGRAPLFDIAFLVQRPHTCAEDLVRFALGEPGGRLDLGGLVAESAPVPQRLARFDLELWISAERDGMLAALRYSTDLFDQPAARDLLEALRTLLDGSLRHPDTPVGRLPLLTGAQRHRLTHDWNATATAQPSGVCLHELVEAAAERAPDAPAVAAGADTLTHRELDERANRIAHALLAAGVGPAEPVAVVLDRGADLVAAVLGVLKAGAAYVPAEPGYPDARIAATFVVPAVRTVLTGDPARFADRAVFPTVRGVLDIASAPAGQPSTRPGIAVDPRSAAYVIPTSGSTGTPKCVLVAHRPVVNTITWLNDRYGVGPSDRVLFLTSLCFDLSVYDIFGVLAAGGSLRVADPGDARDLVDRLAGGEITLWDSAPAALQQLVPLLADRDGAGAARLRLVLLSGDWIPVTLPDRVRAAFPGARVLAMGGATEAAIWSNFHDVERVDPEWPSIPYGRPIANARYYVLDAALRPCPVRVPGELYIGGECLAEGYLGDPGLTAGRFVADPYAARPGARMYRTGDSARFWPDGTLEFLGRVGTMVKIRGYRVEPGEVESVLARHPDVREVAVVGVGQRDAERLVAYLTPEAAAGGTTADWARVFDDVYAQPAEDPAFDLAGWIDGHTGLPFPAAAMREWVDGTVARIHSLLRPGAEVLEIGCGTGLLLSRLAPACARYVGTDVSAAAVAHVRDRVLPVVPGAAGTVEVFQAPADDLAVLAGRRFDVIVLNSVVQYFPDVAYLVAVLRAATGLLAPGGHLFVGDVRNLAVEPELRTSVALARSDPGTPADAVAAAVADERRRERELLLHPDFFARFAAGTPCLAGARVLLKEGAVVNELTAFRFDAVLSATAPATATPVTIHFGHDPADLPGVVRKALVEHPDGVRVTGLTDARLAGPRAAREALAGGTVPHEAAPAGINPGAAVRAVTDARWRAEPRWPESGCPGQFDLLVLPADAPSPVSAADPAPAPWPEFANRPARPDVGALLVPRLREHLRRTVPEHLVPSAFVLLPDGLPVTANGKLDRSALPEPAAPKPAAAAEAPADPVQRLLAEIWADVLGVERIGPRDGFFELGGDSILSIQVVSRAARHGLELAPRDLFRHQTVAELADAVRGRTASAHTADDDGDDLPFGPAQTWFHRLELAEPDHFNQAVHLAVTGPPLDPETLAGAVREAFAGQEVFRLRQHRDGAGWTQHRADEPGVVVEVVRRGGNDAEPVDAVADRLNAGLDLAAGPLARAALLTTGEGCDALLLAVHHVAVDGVSWWTLVEDIAGRYQRRERAPATAGYPAWVRALRRRQDDPDLLAQLPGWRALLGERVPPLPRDRGTGPGTEGDAVTRTRTLTPEDTERLLTGSARAYRTHPDELLLAAFAAAVHRWGEVRRLRLDLEGHGRDGGDLDVSRTVGWFTTFTPVVLDLTGIDPDGEPGRLITAVKQQRRALPGTAAEHEVLRNRPDRPLDDLPAAEIGFNYLGRTDRIGGELFRLVPGAGRTRAAANRRPYLWEVNCRVDGGRFRLAVTSTTTAYSPDRVDALAAAFADALRAVADHCAGSGAAAYTPSDFPLAGLDQDRLASALSQFRRARATREEELR